MEEVSTATPTDLKRKALMSALILGILGDVLLREGIVGPGLVLWVGLSCGVSAWLTWRADSTLFPNVAGWSAVAVVTCALMTTRSNDYVQSLVFLVLPVTLAQVIMLSWGARWGRSLPVDQVYGLLSVPVRALIGGAPLLARLTQTPGQLTSRLSGMVRGLMLALPLLWVFTGLLSSADAAFSRITAQAMQWLTVSDLTVHAVVALILAWVVSGWLEAVVNPNRSNLLGRLPRPAIGRDETLMVLGSMVLLFGGFSVLQLSYLFGGDEMIQSVSGLTVADYARRGFFELVTIAALTIGVLLVVRSTTVQSRLFTRLALALVALVLVMLISAVQRFWLYIDHFGLSLSRLTVLAMLLWMAFTLVFFVVAIYRDRFSGFMPGSVSVGIAIIWGLALANPAALVARVNLDRTTEHQHSLDMDYLLYLGADALPTLLDRADQLPEAERCQLVRFASPERYQPDWRVWNRSEAKAAQAKVEHFGRLRSSLEDCAAAQQDS